MDIAHEVVRVAPRIDMADIVAMYGCHDFRVNVALETISCAAKWISESDAQSMRYTARLLAGWLSLTELMLVRAYRGLPGLEASELEIEARKLTIDNIRQVSASFESKWGISSEERVTFGHDLDRSVSADNQRLLRIIPAPSF